MKSLDQMVSRYRKLSEMIEELSDCLAPLKAEAETLSDEIFAAFSADKSLYNVGVYKTFAVGIIARELVRIDFSDKVTRKKGNERDQDWLKSLLADSSVLPYVRMEMALDKAAIRQDLARKKVSEAFLKPFEIVVAPSAKVKVTRVRKDAEINALIAEARKEAEAEERGE